MGFLIWDFDGTLAIREGGWLGTLCEVVESERPGVPVDPEAIRPRLRAGFPWHAHHVVREPCRPDEWWEALGPLFRDAIAAVPGVGEEDALHLATRVREVYLRRDRWRLFDDVRPTLEALAGSGWRHVILSNHVPELDDLVDALELRPLLDAVYTSGCTGREKPNPAAWECVFADFGEARSGWMIGDNFHADVTGAAGVGMRAILVRNEHPGAPLRCRSLDGVVAIVNGEGGA